MHGRGVFTTAPIAAGEVVIIWGGVLFTAEQVAKGASRQFSYAPIDEGLYLGEFADGPENPDDLMNHSCDPNVWLMDAVTIAARRDITADEELTIDYGMFNSPDWDPPWKCNCGSPICRKRVTGLDYRLPQLQQRYGAHWSPYIRKGIEREDAEA